MYKVTYWVN